MYLMGLLENIDAGIQPKIFGECRKMISEYFNENKEFQKLSSMNIVIPEGTKAKVFRFGFNKRAIFKMKDLWVSVPYDPGNLVETWT